MPASVLDLAELSKCWPGFRLGPLSLRLTAGCTYVLVGENGAGKTTLLSLIGQQLRPSSGTIAWSGEPLVWNTPRAKQLVTFVRDIPAFYPEFTGRETLGFAGRFYDHWSDDLAADVARRFRVDLDKPVRAMSRGTRVKLGILLGFTAPGRVVLLDEPTSGLDPLAREELHALIAELRSQRPDTCLLLSSHIFEDVLAVADEALMMANGQVGRQVPRATWEAAGAQSALVALTTAYRDVAREARDGA